MAEKEVKVPDIGNFKDVEIIDVMVKPGDTVAKEQGLITLETDKAAMDVPSPYAGTVKALKVNKGDKVSEGSLVLVMDAQEAAAKPAAATQKTATSAAAPALTTPAPAAPAPVAQAPAVPAALPPINESGFGKAHAGPSVRKFARELGVDLSRLKGSGRKGRITAEDVKAFVKAVMQGGFAGGGLPKVPEVDFARF
ncbi:MAG TPA: biotin/lipoyl-containing protein, partial [Gammaproteobacteria bacterium]|nr:biotin/lipoyl-containing protein [Gammaproteobacteria bacterium]